jgi:small conductance mechanosensitive channel
MKESTGKIQQYIDQAIDWAVHFAPQLLLALLTLLIGWWALGRFEAIIVRQMQKRQFESSLQAFLRTMFSLGTKIILLIIVAGQVGFQTTSLAAIVGAAGLAVGLALQGSLANFAGGVLILIFKPFKVGDTVTVSGFTGKVYEIQIFNTILLLPDNKTVILPNGGVSNSPIVNSNKQTYLNIVLSVAVPSDREPEVIKQQIIETVYRDSRVLKNPPATAVVSELSGGTIKLQVTLHCSPEDGQAVQYQANENLLAFYKQNAIAF